MTKIKKLLDRYYREYDFRARMPNDPVEFPHRYKRTSDIEISGFIASCFAYGKVTLFKPVVEKILAVMGKSPYEFLMDFKPQKASGMFSGIRYRFNRNKDILCLLHITAEILRKHNSIENAFYGFYRDKDVNIGNALIGFIDSALDVNTSAVYGKNIRPDGLVQFFPSPSKGSACKRMNLFLRWMIRDRDVDLGLWKGIPKNRLIIPLDTHIARISRCLGFTKRRSDDWKTAVEITNALREFDSEDPLKYDFAMCHHGIVGLCRPNSLRCKACAFKI